MPKDKDINIDFREDKEGMLRFLNDRVRPLDALLVLAKDQITAKKIQASLRAFEHAITFILQNLPDKMEKDDYKVINTRLNFDHGAPEPVREEKPTKEKSGVVSLEDFKLHKAIKTHSQWERGKGDKDA